MAKTIEQCFADKRHLIVEAGTGTGKTLAYLLPALRRAREQKQRIIISTGTKNLQEQLYFKDIPFLESLLGPLRVCYMKGRANYVCKQKLYALRDNPLLHGLDEISQFHSILQWERDHRNRRPRRDLRPARKLRALSQTRRAQRGLPRPVVPQLRGLLHHSMRRKALESDIVIVNHHLFFADLAIKQQAAGAPDAGILPEAAAVIFDEAHELEDVASQYFGIALSNARFDELARDTESLLRAKQASSPAIESATHSLRERSRLFFGSLPCGPSHIGRLEFTDRPDFLEASGDAYLGATNALIRLEGELDHLREVDEATGLRKRATDIRNHLKFLLESTDPNTVFWIERRATSGLRNAARTANNRHPERSPQGEVEGPLYLPPSAQPQNFAFSTHLQATPIDVSTLLAETLFANYASVILTSATLTVADAEGKPSFDHLKKRLGIPFPKELVVPSHFDYATQALLYLPRAMPAPRDPDFLPQAAEKIRRVLEITRGRAFCLFTSARADARAARPPARTAAVPAAAARVTRRATCCCSSSARRLTPSSSAPRRSGRAWTCRASS